MIIEVFAGHEPLFGFGIILSALALVYSLLTWVALRKPIEKGDIKSGHTPPVTLLKPLYGAEPETYSCLLSFCNQDYPHFQIVFGVADACDPVVSIVEKLQRERPHLDLQLCIDRRQHGGNRKVSNLMNMMALARHDVLVIADSDVRVQPDYLAKVVHPLQDDRVGIVTCIYRGRPRLGLWPLLGSLFINDWFAPSVRVAAFCGSRAFAFGATIALTRATLSVVGGFEAISNQLADDYRLGELTRQAGLRTILSEMIVETEVSDASFKKLVCHELRWLRTIRAMNPHGYRFLFLTLSLPMVTLGNSLASNSIVTVVMLGLTVTLRDLTYLRTRSHQVSLAAVMLLPLRDALTLGLWGWSFVTRRVQWRDARFCIARDGSLRVIEGT